MNEVIDTTKANDNDYVTIDVDEVVDGGGELRIGLRLNRGDYEMLKALYETPHWKFYSKLMIRTKQAYQNSVLAGVDPYEIVKKAGMAAGINLVINQLPISVAEYDRMVSVEKAEAKAKASERLF